MSAEFRTEGGAVPSAMELDAVLWAPGGNTKAVLQQQGHSELSEVKQFQ